MGTGMAFPWRLVNSIDFATGEGVEDLKLGLDLARRGYPPVFCPSACVDSQFPTSQTGARTQRKRWEQGHLRDDRRTAPYLLYQSLTRGNLRLLALTFDMAIPPLTLLGVLVSLVFVASALGFFVGLSSTALMISAAALLAFSVAVLLCWLRFGRDILPPNSIFLIILYVAEKLPLYRQMVSREEAPNGYGLIVKNLRVIANQLKKTTPTKTGHGRYSSRSRACG